MSQPSASSAVDVSIISLGHDLFATKLYMVAMSALWLYDYFLTLADEVHYAWRGQKKALFYLYLLNRYLTPCYILMSLIAYTGPPSFDLDLCSRYDFLQALQTLSSTCIAEMFITLRVYALLGKHKGVFAVFGIIMVCQCAVGMYLMSIGGSSQPAGLLPRRAELPTLPNADPYHICQLTTAVFTTSWMKTGLSLILVFDGLAFIAILVVTLKMISKRDRHSSLLYILKVIRRDGVLYFFVLFSSNFVWLLLIAYARPALKLVHSQPALVFSGIMVNRITLNLKKASDNSVEDSYAWSLRTFKQTTMRSRRKRTTMPLVFASAQRETSNGGYDLEMESLGREV